MFARAAACRADLSLGAPVIFTQVPVAGDAVSAARAGIRPEWGAGARIACRDGQGAPRLLTEGFAGAADPAVSFDGRRVLFAGQLEPGGLWNIFEMPAEGGAARQVTRDLGDCRNPAYMATVYTLPPPPRVDTDPWEQLMFLSTAAGAMDESGSGVSASLYSAKLDGSMPRRLTFGLSGDADPFLMLDGRVLLATWQRPDLRRGFGGRVSLFGLNLDGLDYAPYVLDEGRRIKQMPCATAGGLVLFVENDAAVPWDGAGTLGAVATRRNLHSYTALTDAARGLYATPSPLPDGAILVARRPADGGGTHALYRFDPGTGEEDLLFDDPEWHDIQPVALLARPVPSGRSTVVSERVATGKFYCLDVALSDRPALRGLRPPRVAGLRVIEGVPLPAAAAEAAYLPAGLRLGMGGPGSHRGGIAPMAPRRILGVVPVESDGSFNIEVPANIPVELQTIDEKGMAIESCAWIWVKNRESRGCIGCHEDPELVPENLFVQALARESHRLLLPPERRRSIDFARDVTPILERRCASPECHGRDAAPPLGGGAAPVDRGAGRAYFSQAYESLLAAAAPPDPAAAGPVRGRYVVPGRARQSPLAWHLFGQDVSAVAPGLDRARPHALMPPEGSPALTDEERRLLLEWIDLGAAWRGPWTGAAAAAPAPEGSTEEESREEMMR